MRGQGPYANGKMLLAYPPVPLPNGGDPMATSWLIVRKDGHRSVVDLRTLTRKGVVNAAIRAEKAGRVVESAYLGGPRPIALCRKVYPRPA